MNRYAFSKLFNTEAAAIQAEAETKKILLANEMPNARNSVVRDGSMIKFEVAGNVSAVVMHQTLNFSWKVSPIGNSQPLPMGTMF